MTTMRSARWAVVRRCAMRIAERPSRIASRARSTTVSLWRSSDDVASSRMSTRGRARKARASARSWRSPADRVWPRSCTGVSRPWGSRSTRSRRPDHVDRFVDLGVGRVGAPEAQVRAHRAREEERLLGHDAQLAAQRVQRHRAHVHAVEQHAALGGVVEAVGQLGHGRLARAGGADEGDRLARGDLEVHVGQDRAARRRRRSPRARR